MLNRYFKALPPEFWLLLMLASVQFTHIVDFMLLMPLGPQLMRLMGIAPSQFSLLVSVYTFSAAAAGFLSIFWIDRVDRKKALIVLYTGFIIGTLLCARAHSYHWLMVGRATAGFFGGVLSALTLAIVGDVVPYERRAMGMGVVMAGFSAASILGVPIGLWIASKSHWQTPFLALSLASGILVVVAIFLMKPIHRKAKPLSILDPIRIALTSPSAPWALALTSALTLGQFTVIAFISPYMVSNVGFSESQLTYIYLCGGFITVFSTPLIGKLADLYGKHLVFSIAVFLSIIPIFLITHMGPTSIPVVLVLTSFFFIVVSGRMIPAMAMTTGAVPAEARGTFMSINMCIQQLSAGTAAYIAGAIIVKNHAGQLLHFATVGYIAIAASLLCLILVKRLKAIS